MKKQTMISAVLAAALCISVTVNVVQFATRQSLPSPDADEASGATTTQATTVPTSSQSNVTMSGSEDSVEISTPYGILYYPAEFTEVYHQGSEEDGVYSHHFYYDFNSETIELFSVHFGDEGRGVVIGSVDVSGELIPITITSTTVTVVGTAQETERFDQLLMSVNDLIASVQAWENYSE